MTALSSVLRLAMVFLATLIVGFFLYLALIRSPLMGGIGILFYRGVMLALVTAAILAVVIALLTKRGGLRIDFATTIGAITTSLSFNLCFLVLIPVTVDRSISVYLLSRIDAEKAQPMTEARLGATFSDEYLGTMHQIHRRVEEQTASGNITVDRDGTIRLTQRGRALMGWFRAAGHWFGTDLRFVERPQDSKTPSAQ